MDNMFKSTSLLQHEFGMIHINDVADMFNVQARTLREWWVQKRNFPKPIVVNGDCILYRICDIKDWVQNTSIK